MKSGTVKRGFTLIEVIMTVALIVILVSMVVGITKRIDDQNKERLCRNELALIDNALEQFRDFGFEYKISSPPYTPAQVAFFQGLNFPLDCSGFTTASIQTTLNAALAVSTTISQVETIHDINYSGSEGLYFCLHQVPECRTTLDKIDKSLLTNKGSNKTTDIFITVNSSTYPFTRIIDPWGTTLQYDYYVEVTPPNIPDMATRKTFPVITSAGADRKFGTNDDIFNRQGK
jgi:prepilin-type N-terminal cleavage/methylation domain-containing protein